MEEHRLSLPDPNPRFIMLFKRPREQKNGTYNTVMLMSIVEVKKSLVLDSGRARLKLNAFATIIRAGRGKIDQ